LHTDNGRAEIVTEVALQFRFPATNDCTGCDQVVWDAQTNVYVFRKGGAPFTDARKSAVTDGLTKAASMIGVGHQVFKGLVRVESDEAARR